MKTNFFLSSAFLIAFLSACGSQKEASMTRQPLYTIDKNGDKQGSLFWAQYTASRRGSMIFVDPNNNVRILSENPPDVAVASITELSAKLKASDEIDAEAVLRTQRSIAELGKRTAAVNMLRDALYRLNEIYYSTRDEKKEMRKDLISNDASFLNDEKDSIVDIAKGLFESTIEENDLKELFIKIMETVQEVSKFEAEASVTISQAESDQEVAKYQTIKSQIETIKNLLSNIDDMTEVEKKKILNQLLELNQKL